MVRIRLHVRLLLLVTLLACGCGGQAPKPSPTATIRPLIPLATQITPTIAPTVTPISTAAPIPTLLPPTPTNTPYPLLSDHGPYLLFQKENLLTILDADGKGRKTIYIPENAYIHYLKEAVSPDGKWLAFFSNTDEQTNGRKPELNLLSIQTSSIFTITQLTTTDFDYISPYYLVVDWSPNGKKLAFAGLLDGPTSEMYIYDLNTQSIQRVTNDQLNLVRMDWSPGGDFIWYENEIPGDSHNGLSFEVVEMNGSLIKKQHILFTDWWSMGDSWISDHEYFLHSSPDGCCGPFKLRYVNVETGQVHKLWEPFATGFALDQEGKVLAVSDSTEVQNQSTYLVDWNGKRTKISNDLFYRIVFIGGKEVRFLGFDGKKVTGITKDGKTIPISDKPFMDASASPDRGWYLLYLYQPPEYPYDLIGVDLYSASNQFVRTITNDEAMPIWRPDSAGFFVLSTELYYVSITDLTPVLVEPCLPDGCRNWFYPSNFVWLPPIK